MKKKIRFGLQAVVVLGVIYGLEMAILSLIYRFLSQVPYRFVAPPVILVTLLVAWVTIFIDMEKKGRW